MTTYLLIDLETDGLDENENYIVEVGAQTVDARGEPTAEPFSSLVLPHPEFVMCPSASGINMISTPMLHDAGSPTAETLGELVDYASGADTWVAHNRSFDERFFRAEWRRWAADLDTVPFDRFICTKRLSYHLYPEMPNHRLMTNYFALGCHEIDNNDITPHRADSDVHALMMVFARQLAHKRLSGLTPAEIRAFESETLPLQTMPCGKHYGAPISEIPIGYMMWAERENAFADRDDDLQKVLMNELTRRRTTVC